MRRRASSTLFVLLLLLTFIPSAPAEAEEVVPQFGTGFDETVIVDSNDGLADPRDLEFHPGRTSELWIANRGTDSITIVSDAGMTSESSDTRYDSHRNHFLEEVSAIAFGAYHPEFDYTWGSAQETANTYCGQAAPNNFMGPTLWPSSLTHFAVEHQNDQYLGSHIDMNHESPYGMGIAHDYDNVYWYYDGYYGELVRYDFAEDHDTGMDDHSDAIVRRYSDVSLSRAMGIPGHMVMDKDSGVLYISDTGADRVLWVNTRDTTVNTQNIMNDASQLEPLAEYSRMTGIEWGVLANGLDLPSGIALEGDRLFVSQNGNGRILALNLATDGKSATEAGTVQTSAVSIMGLEIGPNGNLWYVDNGRDEVIRIDPFDDEDDDGVADSLDNCPSTPNTTQMDHELDDVGDACDSDDDNDGVLDIDDSCALGDWNWTASIQTDHDGDGCEDAGEDSDDDDDSVYDTNDKCPKGNLDWTSSVSTDSDSDGCRDAGEDLDDDNDLICDSTSTDAVCEVSAVGEDRCPNSRDGFYSFPTNDADRDGCEDNGEDLDDDNDGVLDSVDDCPTRYGVSSIDGPVGCPDRDEDGRADSIDAFPDEDSQWSDQDGDGFGDEADGVFPDACPYIIGDSTIDRMGCMDRDRDGWSDQGDAFPDDVTQHTDRDQDGFGDSETGYQPDFCPDIFGTSTEDQFGCLDSDGDQWSDIGDAFPDEPTQHSDADLDRYGDNPTGFNPDACPLVYGTSSEVRLGCPDNDGDGWDDGIDEFPGDSKSWSDTDGDGFPDQNGTIISDDCPMVAGTSEQGSVGCLDSDGDGWADEDDAFPMDSDRHLPAAKLGYVALIGGGGFVLLIGSLAAILLLRGKRIEEVDSSMSTSVQTGPPLPPDGLPAGWTMEQWAWYGADYLKNR